MAGYAPPIRRLITELAKFPGIGEKTATRLAIHILRASADDASSLARSILDVKQKIRFCSRCFNLAEAELCEICRDPDRDGNVICVVEDPDALVSIEESGSYRGLYHVLHGVLSPAEGIGPDQLRIQDLRRRVRDAGVKEVILATNPSVQGESTALLIAKVVADTDVSVSRIAFGVPVGGDLRYVDKMTMTKAFEGRNVTSPVHEKQHIS